ncbi:glycosyltransferase [Ruminococcaceae bacterium OttesenSCG-928-I18]|nr:glycosyltransferase [Ruminococcaceae bacterium OttesenSCG-928-I18]
MSGPQERRLRVLFVITQFYRGGAETALVELFRQLDPARFEIDFLVMNQLKLQKAESLLPDIPPHVKVYNPAGETPNLFNLGWEAFLRVLQRVFGIQPPGRGVRKLRQKQYDWAISYGEWVNPAIVAKGVRAQHKAVWVHTDIDKSHFFKEEEFFSSFASYEKYLFVSQGSMQGAVQRWPRLKEKAVVVHNAIDPAAIRAAGQAPLPAKAAPLFEGPVLVSVGNVRTEKNYPRQVRAMALLRRRGVFFKWLVVGSDVDPSVAGKVRGEIRAAGLEEDFLLLGADTNPHKYAARADAVCVLGDYESWSLVITEALALGVPVIATRTSGALQQVREGQNGLLCDFSAEAIAEAIERFYKDEALRRRLREGAREGGAQNPGPTEFAALVQA